MSFMKLTMALAVLATACTVTAADKKPDAKEPDKKQEAKADDAKKSDDKKADDKKQEAKADDKKANDANPAAALTPEEQAAADAKIEKERQLLIKTKKPVYNKISDAKRVATLLHKPVMVLFIGKGTPAEAMIKKTLFQNKLFMKDFAMKNFVLYKMEIKYGPTKENPKAKVPLTKKMKGDEKKLIELIFEEEDVKTPYVAILKEDMSESIFNMSGHLPELPQFSKELPLQTWMETLVPLMESKKYTLEISPAVRKFIETPIKEKGKKDK